MTTIQTERPQYNRDDHQGLNHFMWESIQNLRNNFHKVAAYGSSNPPKTCSVNMRGFSK
jgi:hypothetical protein